MRFFKIYHFPVHFELNHPHKKSFLTSIKFLFVHTKFLFIKYEFLYFVSSFLKKCPLKFYIPLPS